MGMTFRYTLSQCSDWRTCLLDAARETVTPRVITEADPGHWHLTRGGGRDWITKTRQGCLNKLISEVNYHYDRLYDEKGIPRS